MENLEKSICVLCQSKEKDDLKYGKFYAKEDVAVHYFCLLLTSNLVQEGSDNDGILGFLIKDIKRESQRIMSIRCIYCHKFGANIGCCQSKCRNVFHLICGIEAGAQNQFIGTYRSFCKKDIFKSIRKRPLPEDYCKICCDNFSTDVPYTMALCAPCCKNGWFHKWCLQEFANISGYFFKCPLCNNKTKFVEQLSYLGVFVPEKDADWELEPNAFEDLLERPNTCSSSSCIYESGQNFSDESKFSFYYCNLCGSKAIHKLCKKNNVKEKDRVFRCAECIEIFNNTSLANLTTRDSGIAGIDKSSNEDDFVNIESLDETEDIMDQRNYITEGTNRSVSPKTPVISGSHTLKTISRPRFIETTVNPSIVESVKKAFEKFESARKLYQKRTTYFHLTDSDSTDSSAISREQIVLKSDLQEPENKISTNSKDSLINEYEKNSLQNISEIKLNKKNLNFLPEKKTVEKRKHSTSSIESLMNSDNLSCRNKKQLKLSQINKTNVHSSNEKINSKKQTQNDIFVDQFVNCVASTSKCIPENNKDLETFSDSSKDCPITLFCNPSTSNKDELKNSLNKIFDEKYNSKLKLAKEQMEENLFNKFENKNSGTSYNDSNYHGWLRSKLKGQEPKSYNFITPEKYDKQLRRLRSHNRSNNSSIEQVKIIEKLEFNDFFNEENKNMDSDSDSTNSSTNRRLYLHNQNVLKRNATNKLSPINRKIKSKYMSNK